MPQADRPMRRFVHLLLPDGVAVREDMEFVVSRDGRTARLPAVEVEALASAGVVAADGASCRPTNLAAGWLRRQLAEAPEDAFATQHRLETSTAGGIRINLAESPLLRLATATAGEAAFLAPHQVEAGERVRWLCERARLMPRVTMSYSATHTAGGRAGRAAEIGEMAAEARRALAELHRVLPRDCAEVVLDVCGLEKGLQQIETERGWPRRSAKLVLRIGLDRLAEHFGLSAAAEGEPSRRPHRWMEGDRPPMFGE